MNVRQIERTIFWGVPVCVLLGSLAGISVMTGSAWPWNEVVHEDGHRTLLGTIFYFEHALRELVPDTVLAVAIAGAVRYFFPPAASEITAASRSRSRHALLCLVTVVVIVGGTVYTEGVRSVGDNLAQLHTREGAPPVWGAHWRYHLIGRFAEMMLAFSVAGLVWQRRLTAYGLRLTNHGVRFRTFGVALALFALLTIVFRPTTEPFLDPAFLGHQLRELFTHALVTVPLALGACFSLAREDSEVAGSEVAGSEVAGSEVAGFSPRQSSPIWPIVLAGGLAVVSGAFLLVASLMTGAQSHGQASGLAQLLFPHFFEHSLGYVFVPALAGLLYLSVSRKP